MKKFLALAAVVFSFTACNSQQSSNTTISSDTAVKKMDNVATMPVTADVYVPVDGDVMMKDGKVMIWRNNTWVTPEGDVTLTDGTIISKDGVVKRDGQTATLGEGETVNKDGNFFDKAGKGISKGWDATKKGVSKAGEATGKAVKEAGKAIGKGAKKVGEKTKELVNGKNDD